MSSAAEEYRRITGMISDASGERREREAARVEDLERRFGTLDDRLRAVAERTGMSRLAVHTHWETVLDAMWGEPWMTVPPFPRPDPHADPGDLARNEQEMYEAHENLMALINRPRFGFRR